MISGSRIDTVNPGTLMDPAHADTVAAKLNREAEDGWTYKVSHCPKGTGSSFITVHDWDGFYLGKI